MDGLSRRRIPRLAGQLAPTTATLARMNLLLGLLLLCGLAVAAKQPNILFILTDDQGKFMGGLEHMPKLQVCLAEMIKCRILTIAGKTSQ